jgi:hypothetical protein
MTKLSTRAEVERAKAFMDAQLANGPIDWECKPWKATRSNEQNALLFGCMYPPIAEAMGYDVADIHEFACGTFFGWVDAKRPKTPRNPEGLESRPFRTTTRDENGRRSVMSKADFTKFIETVERIAAKAGVFVPMERAA